MVSKMYMLNIRLRPSLYRVELYIKLAIFLDVALYYCSFAELLFILMNYLTFCYTAEIPFT